MPRGYWGTWISGKAPGGDDKGIKEERREVVREKEGEEEGGREGKGGNFARQLSKITQQKQQLISKDGVACVNGC